MGFSIDDLHGIFPPVVTPIREDEKLDEEALRRLIAYLLEGGVHGLYMLGTTGEFASLTNEVKVRTIEVCRREAGGRVPILAGAGETSTARTLELARLLEQAGADVIFSTPPFYYTYTQEELRDYYISLAESVTVPVFLYNIPQLTKVGLDPGLVRELASDDRIVGIKDSSGNFANYLEHIETARRMPEFRVFIGSEVLAGASVIMGGDGIVASTANVVPSLWVNLYEAAARGDVEKTAEIGRHLRTVGQITTFGTAAGCKAALEIMNITTRQVAAPHRSLSDKQLAEVRSILENVGG